MPTKKDLSTVTAMVCDNGLFVSVAQKLAETYKKVYYHVPSVSAFPKMNLAKIGQGLPGLEVAQDILGNDFDDNIDLYVFLDVGFGPIQTHLESLGKRVWGSRTGENFELDRVGMKELMRKKGLPVGPYRTVKGVAALREHLKTHKDQHVKISRYRGSFETFFAPDYKFVEPKLDEVEYNLGAFKHEAEFVVEDSLKDKIEFGCDTYCIDGQFPKMTLAGPEIKDRGFVGIFKPRAELPEPLTRFDTVMAPTLKQFRYRGFYSTEVRIGKDHVPYMIDHCSRLASPPSELYCEFYTNLAEIVWEGAGGVCLDPTPIAKYGAEALIHSTWADKNFQPLDIPESIRRHVKLRNAMFTNGRFYVIPQSVGLPEIGAVVGWGNTLEAAVEMVKSIAEQVKGYYLEVTIDAFDAAAEEIAKGEKYGLKIF